MYTYYGEAMLVQALLVFLTILVVFYFIDRAFSKSKSKQYREFMTDMLVVGKVRKIAEKDNVDIPQQVKDFRLYLKKKRIEYEPLDLSVEREIQEEVTKGIEDEIDFKELK